MLAITWWYRGQWTFASSVVSSRLAGEPASPDSLAKQGCFAWQRGTVAGASVAFPSVNRHLSRVNSNVPAAPRRCSSSRLNWYSLRCTLVPHAEGRKIQ